MIKEPIELYHYYRSSSSWRVRWALNIKNVKYNATAVNLLAGEQQQQEHLLKNPMGQVPAIKIDHQYYSDSIAIIEWLEEQLPSPPLLPNDSLSRLRVRELASIIHSGTQPLQNFGVQKRISNKQEQRWAYARHWIHEGFKAYEHRLNSLSLHGTFSYGHSVTLADLCLIPQCYNATRFGINLNLYPNIKKIYQNCLQTPECEAASPDHFQPK